MNIAVIAPFQTASFLDVAEKTSRVLRLNHNVALYDMNTMFFPFGRWDKLIYFNTLFLPSLIHLPRFLALTNKLIFSCDSEGIPLGISAFFKRYLDMCIISTPTFWVKENYEKAGIKVHNVIPRAIDPNEFIVDKADVEAYRKQFNDKRILFFNGALHSQMQHQRKGIEELLQAFQIICKKRDDVVLVHLTNHYPWEVGIQVPKEIEGKFIVEKLFGKLSKYEVAVRYHACDVYVQPSHSEGFGMPLVEAMICCKPPIHIHGGAMKEVVGEYGIKVEPTHVQTFNFMNLIEQIYFMFEPKDLAEAILWCLDNEEQYEELGIKAKEYAERKYNCWQVYREFEKV